MLKKLISSVLFSCMPVACGYSFPPANDLAIVGGIKDAGNNSLGNHYFVTVCNYSEKRDKREHELIAEYEVIFRLNNQILNASPRLDQLLRNKCLDSEIVTIPTGQKGKLTAYADWRNIEDYPRDNYATREIGD